MTREGYKFAYWCIKTYQLRAMDREQLPEDNNIADSYVRFYHNGELQSVDVRYYNIFTVREEEDNMTPAVSPTSMCTTPVTSPECTSTTS